MCYEIINYICKKNILYILKIVKKIGFSGQFLKKRYPKFLTLLHEPKKMKHYSFIKLGAHYMISAQSRIVYCLRFFLIVLMVSVYPLDLMYAQILADPANAQDFDDTEGIDTQEDDVDGDQSEQEEDDDRELEEVIEPIKTPKTIKNIIIEGVNHIPLEAVMRKIPYKVGEVFDKQKTNALIKNIYSLGYFKHVRVLGQTIDADTMNLIVVVQEKKFIEGVVFKGNVHLTEKDIKKKVNFSQLSAVDEEDLAKYVAILKKMYRDKDYHNVQIQASLQTDDNKATVVFDIKENHKSLVKRVFFTGNSYFTSKKLRSLIFTREDWLLGFLDRAGSYQPDAIEGDRHTIENYYQSNGFLNAHVIDVNIDMDAKRERVNVTFSIQEGEQYTISSIKVPGNELISEDILLAQLPVRVGDLYSKEKIRESMEVLRLLWGEYGYINADIEPSIQPDDDNKTVAIGFYSELGSKVYLDRINIIGNEKTYDRVIRRQLTLKEGGLLTTQAMDESKNRVELLGYFDTRNGVNWKINRIDKNKATLDLIVKEVKTGRLEWQLGFNGSPEDFSSPMKSLSLKMGASDTNLFGRGIQFNLNGEISKEERNILFNLTDPWLFDRPISAGVDVFSRRSLYDEFNFLEKNEIHEEITGGSINIGFLSQKLLDSLAGFKLGFEGVTYKNLPKVSDQALTPEERIELQEILNKRFASGNFIWFGGQLSKDVRNHPLHPSRGYQWFGQTKIAFTNGNERREFGFFKLDLDASWYSPLIGERDLVFCLHGHLGLVVPFKNRTIPFRELYNVGGPASVRGFLFGEIGPNLVSPLNPGKRNILGAQKAFWLNAELSFPISRDFSMKGALFYDGGAGWDTPDADEIAKIRLRNNSFSYRHAIGFGVRLLRPTPMKVDWGFKLDPRRGENRSEIHFSAYHEF